MYPLPATKLKGPTPQLVFCALLSCTLWASLEVLHNDPPQFRTYRCSSEIQSSIPRADPELLIAQLFSAH